jgi:death-on-curing protein
VNSAGGNCFHLTVEIVQEIHAEALISFGGADGLRDIALLESAVAAPQATFQGRSPYSDVVETAAAYLYYICKNHPFIDGNKRTAFGACLLFLHLNGMATQPDGSGWEELVLGVADGSWDRESATAQLRILLSQKTNSA